MQVKCAYSGITFTCEHFPAAVSSKELVHPVFYLRPAKLISLSTMWAEGKLTEIDSYLLFLALLESTELVQFRSSVLRTPNSDAIVSLNMEKLVSLTTRILHIPNKKTVLPSFALSHGANDLTNVAGWLGAWEEAIHEYAQGYLDASARNKLLSLESILQRRIRDSSSEPRSYSQLLANWAEIAASFPSGDTLLPGGQKIPLNMYWKSLIVKCCLDDSIFTVSSKDLAELILHCEENLEHGSIYAFNLMKVLREAHAAQIDFFRGGRTSFKVLSGSGGTSASSPSSSLSSSSSSDSGEDVEATNIARIISQAPEKKPLRHEYPTMGAYIKAAAAWELAQQYSKGESA